MKISNIVIGLGVFAIIMLIIVPVPPAILDVLLVTNISASLMILLITLYIKGPLEFSAFPSLVLIMTLFRVGLSLASTRLILGNGGNAGEVIDAFGSFVTGGNLVVGAIMFLIIIIVQFIVITKGAERVAEVAARFTLDAMPGKQMAIDADLNAGVIDDQTARERRANIQRESDFYGAMDGSSKFVKGDAIVSILVTIINIVGGIIIGTVSGTMEFSQVLVVYTIATIGEGLVSQISALMTSTATGIIVTRAASTEPLGSALAAQLTAQPNVFFMLAGLLTVLGIIPGLPTVPFFIIAIVMAVFGVLLFRAARQIVPETSEDDAAEDAAKEKRKPENVATLLQVDLIGIELGYGIVSLVDVNRGGDLLERVIMIRRQCALDLGMIVPVIRLRDNIQLRTNEYVIRIKGVAVARGEVMPDHLLALSTGQVTKEIEGIETTDPTFGLPALWIREEDRERAEIYGYKTVDAPSVIATHLTETLKRHGHELMTRQQVQTLVDNLKAAQPALVDEVIPKIFSLGELQKILAALLRENVSIRDMATILETLGDYGTMIRDTAVLTEYVRKALYRSISERFIPDKKARVLTISSELENLILTHVKQTEYEAIVTLDQESIQKLYNSLSEKVREMNEMGVTPIILTSPIVRRHFRSLTATMIPDITVLSFNEIDDETEIISGGVIDIN